MGRTYEALLRAEKQFQELLKQKISSEKIEPLLNDQGLSESQILDQSPDQLKRSLTRISRLIKKLDSGQLNDAAPDMESKRVVLQGLLRRKELVLGCLDIRLTNNKKDEIKNIVNAISEEKIKSALIANLDELDKLNNFFSQEYLRILRSKKRIITQGK